MKLIIEYKSEKPIYQQLYEQITFQILNGELEGGFCLPSIRSLARELGISIITVKSAYENLEKDGYIFTEAGKGCFVNYDENFKEKRHAIIQQKILEDLKFYNSMGLSEEELYKLIKENLSTK